MFRKDLQVELRRGEVVTTSGFFAVLVVVIGSLSFYGGPDASVQVAPGVIWVAIAFSSVLALSRTWQREREHDALSGLLALPLSRSAVFAGKALGVAGFIAVIEVLVVLPTLLMFDIAPGPVAGGLLLLCATATPGIAAAGTLFGAMTVRTEARDLVLAVVLFPLLAPTLLAAVAGTRELFLAPGRAQLGDYVTLMAVFGVVFISGGIGLFGSLIEG